MQQGNQDIGEIIFTLQEDDEEADPTQDEQIEEETETKDATIAEKLDIDGEFKDSLHE